MSTSDFRFFRVPEPSLSVLTVIYHILVSSFRRKVTGDQTYYTSLAVTVNVSCSVTICCRLLTSDYFCVGVMTNASVTLALLCLLRFSANLRFFHTVLKLSSRLFFVVVPTYSRVDHMIPKVTIRSNSYH